MMDDFTKRLPKTKTRFRADFVFFFSFCGDFGIDDGTPLAGERARTEKLFESKACCLNGVR